MFRGSSPYGTITGYSGDEIFPYLVLWDDFNKPVLHALELCIILPEPNDILKEMIDKT